MNYIRLTIEVIYTGIKKPDEDLTLRRVKCILYLFDKEETRKVQIKANKANIENKVPGCPGILM